MKSFYIVNLIVKLIKLKSYENITAFFTDYAQ